MLLIFEINNRVDSPYCSHKKNHCKVKPKKEKSLSWQKLGGYDGDYPIEKKKTQKHLQKRLDELKARSVRQTTINLENQLFGVAALQAGIIRFTDDTISHQKWHSKGMAKTSD
ncbi:hypothetical protein [Gimesia aquarii]|uniref:hypothetical protein n=1 Tax=Gimesia aquarii TaxID=2527964 RepID=UPI0011A2AA14|nr:hypothetical protein [Gimesia aquarii]